MRAVGAPIFETSERALVLALTCFVRGRRGLNRDAHLEELRRELARADFSWERFTAFAHRHRVVPMVHDVLRAVGAVAIPERERERVRDEARRQLLFAEASFQRLRSVSAGLAREGLRHAAYKGPAFALQAYGDVGLRTFGDLDVLVPRRELERVVAWATRAGYTLPEWDDPSQRRWVLAHMHHVSAHRASPFADAHLELHWMTLPMMRPGTPDVDAWLEGDLEEVDGVPVLPWPRAYASTVEHHAKHGWSRLLYLVDCTVRPAPEPPQEPVLDDRLGIAVLEDAARLSRALVAGTLLDDAPALLVATWHAMDPYQFEVGEAYLDELDPSGAWGRRRARFRSVGSVANRREAVYAFARQVFLEASVARGRVFGMRPNDANPLLKRLRDAFR